MGKLFKSLLFWNQSANLKQIWHGWSLGNIFSKLCPVTTTYFQRRRFLKKFTTYDDDGRQVMAIAHLTLWVRWAKLEAQVSLYRSPDINKSFRSTNKYGPQGQFLFLIGYCLKKSSPLKLLGKMEPNLTGSIYVRFSIKLRSLVVQ
jgi:hypothetical protein